jgi:hypothetical protein
VDRNSTRQIKKFADFETETRHFDSVLEQLQDSLYDTAQRNEQDFKVYMAAQSVRDFLFVLVRKKRGIPDPTNPDDFDCGGGEVLRAEE